MFLLEIKNVISLKSTKLARYFHTGIGFGLLFHFFYSSVYSLFQESENEKLQFPPPVQNPPYSGSGEF